MTILAAIDDSAVARPVLNVARDLGELFAECVESIHVQEDHRGRSAGAIARAAQIPLQIRYGDIVSTLRSEAYDRDAMALVVGARGVLAGPFPAGHVAMRLVQSLDLPVVLVPPRAADRPLRRILVAVEGNGESHALNGLFARLGDRFTPEVIALHVIEPSELPPFSDSGLYEADAFEREFMIRVSSLLTKRSRIRFEMRVGAAADAVRDAARELDVDLVVIAWHRDLSGGHGRLVRELLGEAAVPVLLLPIYDHDVASAHRPRPAGALR